MSEVYKSKMTVLFHQADPAGIMFFAHVFTLAHNAYEGFIQACGFDWKDWFAEPKFLVPIRHSEADYLRPFRAGESYEIEARVTEISSTSFKIHYDFLNGPHKHAVVQMVHTCIDPKTFQKSNLPEEVKLGLKTFYHQSEKLP
ncbi:MAG: acyl-CoA thioesterase [Bdellovibrionaceae bacterium]|nr:acyl-CoA thioesterase [Bdellovibrio sp.]